MGFMNWLMNGVGFETEEVYDNSVEKQKKREEKLERQQKHSREKAEEKARKAQEKADRAAKRYSLQQEKDVEEKTPEPKPEAMATSYNPTLGNFGASSTNVGGYGSNNVEFVYPTTFDDVTKVISLLKEGESVMLNLNQMNDYESQRLLDCTSGAVFALNGNIMHVNSNIYLITPEGFNIKVPQNPNINPNMNGN